MNALEEAIVELAVPVLDGRGLELVDIETSRKGKRLWLRLFIDRKDRSSGGVTVNECGDANLALSDVLDAEDLIDSSYTLEVSSPGVNRRLRFPEHFRERLGEKVFVKARRPMEGRKNFKGTLVAAGDAAIEIEIDGTRFEIGYEDIARAHLEYSFD